MDYSNQLMLALTNLMDAIHETPGIPSAPVISKMVEARELMTKIKKMQKKELTNMSNPCAEIQLCPLENR